MATLTFKGGIHPYDGKDLTKDKPIKEVLPKGDLVYPLSQHIGAPARPVVSEGDNVTLGQTIGTTDGALGADIHSSADGIVDRITDKYIIIERTNR